MKNHPLVLMLGLLALETARAADGTTVPESPAIRARIEGQLAERHPSDTPEWWRSLGPGAVPVIISMHESSEDLYERLRLVEGLAWFDDARAVAFLKRQTRREDVVRNAAIRSIGTSQGARELDFVGSFLLNEDPQTRYLTALAVKRIADDGSAPAHAVLARYLASERTDWIVAKVRAASGVPKAGDAVRPAMFVARSGDGLRATASAPVAAPVPAAAPSASAAAALAPALAGEWSGFWITLKPGGLASAPARLTLGLGARARDTTGTLATVGGGGTGGMKKQSHRIERVAGRGVKFQGSIGSPKGGADSTTLGMDLGPNVRGGASDPGTGAPTGGGTLASFEAELTELAAEAEGPGRYILTLRLPRTGATIVLRKVR